MLSAQRITKTPKKDIPQNTMLPKRLSSAATSLITCIQFITERDWLHFTRAPQRGELHALNIDNKNDCDKPQNHSDGLSDIVCRSVANFFEKLNPIHASLPITKNQALQEQWIKASVFLSCRPSRARIKEEERPDALRQTALVIRAPQVPIIHNL